MKELKLYIALILSCMLVLSSCGSGKTKDGKDTNGTLTFSTFLEEGAEADAYKEIIDQFESKNPKIKVNLVASPVGYDEKIKSSLTSGNGPDIIGLQRSSMLEYAKQGNLMDISEWVTSENIKERYFGVCSGYGKIGDKYYGIGDYPKSVEWFYNVDMFKKAGVDEPRSINELISACNKLKNYTQTPIALGAKDGWELNTFFGMISVQTINTDDLSKAFMEKDTGLFSSLTGADDAVSIMSQLIKSGAISRKSVDTSYADAVEAFVKGKAAILPAGSWAVDKIEKVKPKGFNYKVFESPVAFAANPNSLYSATGIQVITVNAKTKNKNEAMEFMKYLFSDDAQKIIANSRGISGDKAANEKTQNSVKSQILKHLENTDEKSTVYVDNISSKISESTASRLQQLITGKLKPAEVWNLISGESVTK